MAARRQVIVWSWSLQTGPFVGDDAQVLLSDDERARQDGGDRRAGGPHRGGERLVIPSPGAVESKPPHS